MPGQKLFVHAEGTANLAYFVFVERSQRLDDAAAFDQRLNAAHSIVMRFDEIRLGAAARLNRVRVNSALAEYPLCIEKVFGCEDALLHSHKLLPDRTTFGFRIDHFFEHCQKLPLSLLDQEVLCSEFLKHASHEFRLGLAHQSGIDIDAVNTIRTKR